MKEFLLIFRRDTTQSEQYSPEQMQHMVKQWQDWKGSLDADNRIVSTGRRMDFDGKVIWANKSVTNGPFVEIKEVLAGYGSIRAKDIDEAVALAKGCPILLAGGSVEVRQIVNDDGSK